jgi:CxxC motif-containing protein
MTPLFKKLNFKDQKSISVLNCPSSFESELSEMSSITKILRGDKKIKSIDFVICFVRTQYEIEKFISDFMDVLP